jgi:hypothetical protein
MMNSLEGGNSDRYFRYVMVRLIVIQAGASFYRLKV